MFVGVAIPYCAVDTVGAHQLNAFRRFGIADADHTAFSGGDGFGGIKREHTRIAEGAAVAVRCFCRKGMSCILDNRDVVFLGEAVNRLHIAEVSCDMDRYNRFNALILLEFIFDFFRIDTVRVRFDIRIDRFSAEVQGAGCSRDKGIRTGEYFGTRADSESFHRKHQSV